MLNKLRFKPYEHCKDGYYVDTANIKFMTKGGAVRVHCKKVNRINTLILTQAPGDDYYFPYIQGAGSVEIPKQNLKNGALILTGGMNGCALDVRYKDNAYIFYHDQNARSLSNKVDIGRCVCRFEPKDYWPSEVPMDNRSYPIIQFICIYLKGEFHVHCYGILTNGQTTPLRLFKPRGSVYRGKFNYIFKLTTFN